MWFEFDVVVMKGVVFVLRSIFSFGFGEILVILPFVHRLVGWRLP